MEANFPRERKDPENRNEEEDEFLNLTLALSPPAKRPRIPSPTPPTPPPPPETLRPDACEDPSISAVGAYIDSGAPRKSTRRNSTQKPRRGKDVKIPPPFPWATDRRATVYNLEHLISSGIHTISGEFQCKKCESREEIKFNLQQKFAEVANFIRRRKCTMHDRAPSEWMNPTLADCRSCGQKESMKPVIPPKKREINWLFLLLGQMLGCCNLRQLKYFCKHTKNHRTGAKDRVLYLTYLGVCKQLDPTGPFGR